jgi:hypothetical protein
MKFNALVESYIGQGRNFKVDDHGTGRVIKRPLRGEKIHSEELKKAEFMKVNEASNVFVKVLEITPEYIVTEKVDVEYASKIAWTFATEYLEMSGQESEDDIDEDYISDFIAKDVLNPKSKFDWKWVMNVVKNNYDNPEFKIFNMCATKLFDLTNRIKTIKKWPVTYIDLHAENIGLDSTKKLIITDF